MVSDEYARAETVASFLSLVDIRGVYECWPWKGGMKSKTDPKQMYGLFMFEGKQRNAHRVAYILTHGDPGPDLDVCHRCDNPICCNPVHLYAGTEQENMREAHMKLRHSRSAFTPEQVREIRRRIAEVNGRRGINKELAREYGVSDVLIAGIKTGRSYGWVT
jgi:hypothetical protein